ncbi:PepSY domain-containing protein [Serinibacter arcticus]|uniref:PepSY domain-containing protein n=1 Tax=Serinibacter arcticus TaxID=1655435 RepID=A0A4Z1E504_9MICO|nr:PepSY domain-containing protein [Serinibacter arcticus]TGO04711.1 hypothetical protein SERN_2304 [Serinibacter arcticus]
MTRITTALGVSAALALTLTVGACSTSAPTDGGSAATANPATPSSSESSSAAPTTSSSSSPTPSSTTGAPADGAGDAGPDDRTAAGLAAIGIAESETGGVAYAIDDSDDDGGWEVDVRTGDTSVEVRVGADGVVSGTEADDLDGEDRRILDAVGITLAQAIEAAVAETGGTLDDADLTDDDGDHVEVTVDTAERTDVDVHLDPVSGDVLRVG